MAMSKTDEAYAFIKDEIISGLLAPGVDLSEDELQKKLGVSRTPIREAVQRLQKEGFVTIYPRKGIIVTDISVNLIAEIFDVRSINEVYVARKAFGKIPDEFMLEMRKKFLYAPEQLTFEEKAQYYTDLDAEFHLSQLPYCQNRFIIETMNTVADHERRIRLLTFSEEENNFCVAEHVEMIDFFLQRDLDKLLLAVERHVDRAKRIVFDRLAYSACMR